MYDHNFFQNKDCPYFPCHVGASAEEFNCLFCYCPLYALGKDCGGNFTYTESGTKDCSSCALPHGSNGIEHINRHIHKILELTKK